MKTIITKQPHEIPEVAEFEQVKTRLRAIKQANAQFFNEFEQLISEYNQKLEAAEKAVRAQQVRCGDFDLYQTVLKVDGEKLFTAIGREEFLSIGGTITMETSYKITAKRLEIAKAQQKVDTTLCDEVVTEEMRYHRPPPAGLP